MSITRRDFLRTSAASAAALSASLSWERIARAASKGTIDMADVGVADPGGDWSKFTKPTGWDVNIVAIGNAPSKVLNVLLAGGGTSVYDLVSIVGGMQKPLVENNLVEPLDTSRIPRWKTHDYIQHFIVGQKTGLDFAGYKGKIYMLPMFFQGDSIGYLPEFTGKVDSYGALFDPKFRGHTAVEDNFTTCGQKTALYLKKSGMADIADPSNMTPGEVKRVVDFLVDKKKEGQFRLIWTSFEQSVNLFVNKEVYVQDCWEPMVFAARKRGVKCEYAVPKEGYLLWSYGPYLVNNPKHDATKVAALYDFMNFLIGPWYGAKITLMRGYLTSPDAPRYAREHPHEFTAEEAARVAKIQEGVKAKFALGGTWQQRWPDHVDVYEQEWARFRAA